MGNGGSPKGLRRPCGFRSAPPSFGPDLPLRERTTRPKAAAGSAYVGQAMGHEADPGAPRMRFVRVGGPVKRDLTLRRRAKICPASARQRG